MPSRNARLPWTREQIRRGRDLVQRGSETFWQLGDLALEVAPMGDVGKPTGALAIVRAFAAEIGVSNMTLRGYRTVAAAYPPSHRKRDLSFAVHREVMTLPRADRLPALRRLAASSPRAGGRWTVDDVRREVTQRLTLRERKRRTSTGLRGVRHELRFALGRVQRAIDAVDGEDGAEVLPELRDLERRIARVLADSREAVTA